jgi:hypothetical protein
MPRPKLHAWLKPGSDDYRAVVHAYFHLLQEERFIRLAALGDQLGMPHFMVEDFRESAVAHGIAFERQIAEIPTFAGYVMDRQYERLEWRLRHQMDVINSAGERGIPRKKRDRSTNARRERKARYN